MHHLAFWICSPQPSLTRTPNEDAELEGVCQRLWQSDSFLVTSPVLSLGQNGRTNGPAVGGIIMAKKDARGSFSIDLPSAPPRSDSTTVNRSTSRRGYPSDKPTSPRTVPPTTTTTSPRSSNASDPRRGPDPFAAPWEPPSYSYSYSTSDQQSSAAERDNLSVLREDPEVMIGRNIQTGWYQGEDGGTDAGPGRLGSVSPRSGR